MIICYLDNMGVEPHKYFWYWSEGCTIDSTKITYTEYKTLELAVNILSYKQTQNHKPTKQQ